MTPPLIRPIISDGHYPTLSISTHQVSKVMCCVSIIHILINLFAKCSVGWVRVSSDLFVVSIEDICSTQVLDMLKLKRYYFIQRQGVQTIGVNRSSKLLILIFRPGQLETLTISKNESRLLFALGVLGLINIIASY